MRIIICLLASVAMAQADDFPWDETLASVVNSMDTFHGSGEVHLVRRAARESGTSEFKVRFYTSSNTNTPGLEIDAHTKTVFDEKDGIVYYTVFHPSTPGCTVVAFDLNKHKEIWRTRLKAREVGINSTYSNKLNLNVFYFRGIQILGREAAGDYIEILDPKTGVRLEHTLIEKHDKTVQPTNAPYSSPASQVQKR